MSDKERLATLLDSWGVPYMMKGGGKASEIIRLVVGENMYYPNQHSDKVVGYSNFFTAFEFTPDGAFLRMGAWE